MTEHEELLGADFFEHDIRHPGVGVSRAISVLKNFHDDVDITIPSTKTNEGIMLKCNTLFYIHFSILLHIIPYCVMQYH